MVFNLCIINIKSGHHPMIDEFSRVERFSIDCPGNKWTGGGWTILIITSIGGGCEKAILPDDNDRNFFGRLHQ